MSFAPLANSPQNPNSFSCLVDTAAAHLHIYKNSLDYYLDLGYTMQDLDRYASGLMEGAERTSFQSILARCDAAMKIVVGLVKKKRSSNA